MDVKCLLRDFDLKYAMLYPAHLRVEVLGSVQFLTHRLWLHNGWMGKNKQFWKLATDVLPLHEQYRINTACSIRFFR